RLSPLTPSLLDALPIFADLTQAFNASDVSYFLRVYIQTVAVLGFFPLHITADAAYDAWYVYQTCAHRDGIMAIPKNGHGHEDMPDRKSTRLNSSHQIIS